MTQQFSSDKKAMTLVELILAIILLNIIILTGLSVELGMRRIFSSTDIEAQLLAEAVPIMTMVVKDINQAVGDVVNVAADDAYSYDPTSPYYKYYIRRDTNSNGLADIGDQFAEYRYSNTTYTLDYRPYGTGVYNILSNRVTQFSVSAPGGDGISVISLTLRKNASLAVTYTNPQVTLNSRAQYRGFSYK